MALVLHRLCGISSTLFNSASGARALCTVIPEDLLEFKAGRARAERADSVTIDMLEQRKAHKERILSIPLPSKQVVAQLKDQGFGQKRMLKGMYLSKEGYAYFDESDEHVTGAGGHAVHLASASGKPWPIFDHFLPEIAFAGHSNSGKSTLVNAMIGTRPRAGIALVSDRAGWTDQVCFYQLGRRPPLFNLVDLPGYGHAVADGNRKHAWKVMIRDYLSSRPILSKCCILVDCTRGLCVQDFNYIRFLSKLKVDWSIVLTKCDLLTVEELYASRVVVAQDVAQFMKFRVSSNPNIRKGDNIPVVGADDEQAAALQTEVAQLLASEKILFVSAATGAGIGRMFRHLNGVAQRTSAPFVNDRSVREHVNANSYRQSITKTATPRGALKMSNRVRNKIK